MRLAFALFMFLLPISSLRALPPQPEELPGALILAGSGNLLDSVRTTFFEMAGKEKAKIVVIPTAAADADDAKAAEKYLAPWKKLEPLTVTLLHTLDRKKADDPAFVKPIAEATAVWIDAGNPARFKAAYKDTLVEKELSKLFQRGKLIGAQAGSAGLPGDFMLDGGLARANTTPGFGWLPGFIVDARFQEQNRVDRLLNVIERHPGYVGLGIDAGMAVLIRGRHLVPGGDSFAVVCLAGSKTKSSSTIVLKGGEMVDLFSLRRGALARAGEAFPPAKPADPVVPKGSLFIVGGGGLAPGLVKRFVELAGGVDAPFVVVSSAYDDPVPLDPGECKMLRNAGAKNVKTLHTRDRKEANKPEFLKDLKEAKGLWFSGGRQWRFVDSYEGTEAEKLFRDVLARGGVIGGSSAGASIQSEYMPRGHPLGNTVMMAEGYERGFGYLPGVAVDQHFFARKRTRDMAELVDTYPQLLGIGIDEGTVAIVRGSVMEVAGKSKIAVFDRRKPVKEGDKGYEEIPAGAKYDLKKRERIDK